MLGGSCQEALGKAQTVTKLGMWQGLFQVALRLAGSACWDLEHHLGLHLKMIDLKGRLVRDHSLAKVNPAPYGQPLEQQLHYNHWPVLTTNQPKDQFLPLICKQQPSVNYNKRTHMTYIKDIPRVPDSGDHENCHWFPQNTYIRPL